MPPAEAAAKIPCPTPQHLQAELAALSDILEPGETEETWDRIEKAIIRFSAVVRGGGYKHGDMFVTGVGNKGIGLGLVDCMLSDRGRLSGAATDLLQTFAPRLATHFHPLVNFYLPPLVRLLARPNKVYLKRAEKCLSTIISNCPLPSIILHLRNGLDDKSDACKRAAATAIVFALERWDAARWHERDLELLELCVRKMASDKDAQVRKTGKEVWGIFQETWPQRVEDFTTPLTPTVRKYLDLPLPDGAAGAGPSRRLAPVPRPALGRAGGLGPSHPAHPPVSSSSASRLANSTGSDKAPAPTPAPVAGPSTRLRSQLSGSAQRPTERTASDQGRARDPSQPRLGRTASTRVISHASSSSSLTSSKSALAKPVTRPTTSPQPVDRRAHRPVVTTHDDERHNRATSALSHYSASSASSVRTNTTPMSARAPSPLLDGPTATPVEPRSASDPTTRTVSSRVRERVTELERLASETPPKHLTPTRGQQLAAGLTDTPVSKPGAAAYSPSLSMLLGKHKTAADGDVTLADLSADVTTITATESPLTTRASLPNLVPTATVGSTSTPISASSSVGLPHPTVTRSPSVSELITKFSPNTLSTPNRPLLPDVEPPLVPMSDDEEIERRISPLPRRRTEDPPAETTPRSSRKRKGSDLEVALAAEPERKPEAEPVPALAFTDETPVKPRTRPSEQPLISFFDTPSPEPFKFGASLQPSAPNRPRASIFSALMGLEMDAPAPSAVRHAESIAEDDEEEGEDGEGDMTVRHVDLVQIEASESAAEEEDADMWAIFISKEAVVVEPETVDLAEKTETLEVLADEPVQPVQHEEPAAQPVQDIPSTPVRPTKAVVAPTPLPQVLAEFDALTEPEEAIDEEPAVLAAASPVVGAAAEIIPEDAPALQAKEASPEHLIDTAKPDEVAPPSPLEEMKELVEAPTADLLKISTGSTMSAATAADEPEPSPALPSPTEPKAPRERTRPPSAAERTRPTSAADRRPKSAMARTREPVEKKSFRPVSRLHDAKAAPAPARLAGRSGGVTAPTAASLARAPAQAPVPAAAPTRAPKPTAPPAAPSAPAPAPERKPATRVVSGSNLFKPTAATAARAAATAAAVAAHAEAKDKEARDLLESKEKPASRPASAFGAPITAAAAAPRRPVGGAFGSTAASRAREAVLPPIKRQRIKLTAPQESFRPGRNKSKAAILGSGAAGPTRRVRPGARTRTAAPAADERDDIFAPVFQADNAKSSTTTTDKVPQPAPAPAPVQRQPSRQTLDVPDDNSTTGGAPTSPSSSRRTSHSDISAAVSPSKLKMPAPRPLSPVLTPTHSASVSATVSSAGPVLAAPVADSPAVIHARRVSGIPASLKKTLDERRRSAAFRQQSQVLESPSLRPQADVSASSGLAASPPALTEMLAELNDDDEPAGGMRRDVSTPRGKAASLLHRLQEDRDRRVLSPRDANAPVAE